MNINDFNCIIGVDCGRQGGIAVWTKDNVKVVKMPKDLNELTPFLQYYKENYNPIAFIEKLTVRPDDISVQNGQPNFGKLFRIQKMLANYEQLKLVFENAGVPFCLCHPMTWESRLKVRSQIKLEKAERKKRYADFARKWFPQVKVTLWNADALLILAFGQMMIENEPKWIYSNLPQKLYEKLF